MAGGLGASHDPTPRAFRTCTGEPVHAGRTGRYLFVPVGICSYQRLVHQGASSSNEAKPPPLLLVDRSPHERLTTASWSAAPASTAESRTDRRRYACCDGAPANCATARRC